MITDWDDAYNNGKYIEGAGMYAELWKVKATEFRDSFPPERASVETYGSHPREVYDLYLPETTPVGIVVFVHGGYWHSLNQRYWSHLAAGPLAHGWAVAMPGYPLCPEVDISSITQTIISAITHIADRFDGPIHLAGHSAGGHLVTRMACDDLYFPYADRLENIVSISGVHDLRPLTRTELNTDLRLTMESASAESPALKTPREGTALTCWVGAAERPEFRRQSALLSSIWSGSFLKTRVVEAKGHNHYSVVGDLGDPQSALTRAVIDPHHSVVDI